MSSMVALAPSTRMRLPESKAVLVRAIVSAVMLTICARVGTVVFVLVGVTNRIPSRNLVRFGSIWFGLVRCGFDSLHLVSFPPLRFVTVRFSLFSSRLGPFE